MTELTEFVDDNPERAFGNSERVAFILNLSARQVRRLAAERVLPREADGSFNINDCVDAYVAHKTAPQPAANEALDRRRAELIERRLERAALEEISMEDALESLDLITGAFQAAIDMVAQELGEAEDAKRVAWVFLDVKSRLADEISILRIELQTGRSAER